MNEQQVLADFQDVRLCMGMNYFRDEEDKIWEIMVWALGGIWYVKEVVRRPNETEHNYQLKRLRILSDERTIFKALA